ncbi:hypothetical protein TNCV_1336311 [Trichonephila clavipes]|nr:hypothetical protein TNCV_1336311 [Trichonephila clavipes]
MFNNVHVWRFWWPVEVSKLRRVLLEPICGNSGRVEYRIVLLKFLKSVAMHNRHEWMQKPKSTVSDVIVKWKHRGSETAEKRSGRPKILGERSRRTLKRVVKQNRKSLLMEISQEFQSSSGISVSSRTVHRELKTWDSMVVHPLTSQTSLHRMRGIDCNGIELTVILDCGHVENCSLE